MSKQRRARASVPRRPAALSRVPQRHGARRRESRRRLGLASARPRRLRAVPRDPAPARVRAAAALRDTVLHGRFQTPPHNTSSERRLRSTAAQIPADWDPSTRAQATPPPGLPSAFCLSAAARLSRPPPPPAPPPASPMAAQRPSRSRRRIWRRWRRGTGPAWRRRRRVSVGPPGRQPQERQRCRARP